jgi:hypothetical protein
MRGWQLERLVAHTESALHASAEAHIPRRRRGCFTRRRSGVRVMEHEADHAYAAGYEGTRAVRTWQERMKVLVQAGFIKTVDVGNQKIQIRRHRPPHHRRAAAPRRGEGSRQMVERLRCASE